MQLILKQNQIFTTVSVAYQGMTTDISDVLIDTGSATSILAVDAVASISIEPVLEDIFHTIRGVGGTETVFVRHLDYLQVKQCCLPNFEIEIGGMDYGFEINGILGMDFLIRAKAIINLAEMRMDFADSL
ncbi:conserved hypothetical protein [Beggiatoa sp. PS]|nr:conserved hypothetical protein [Beggiatoa sp. PS]